MKNSRNENKFNVLLDMDDLLGDIDEHNPPAEQKAFQPSVNPPLSRFQKAKPASGISDEIDSLLKRSFGYVSQKGLDNSGRKNPLSSNVTNEWDVSRPDTAMVNRVRSMQDRKQAGNGTLVPTSYITRPLESELVRKYGWMDNNQESTISHSALKQQTTVPPAEFRPTTAFPSQRNETGLTVAYESKKSTKRSIFQSTATNSFDTGHGSLFEPRVK